jgi:hypothetical protein
MTPSLVALLHAAFIVSAQDEHGRYLGDMSAKAALAELAAKDHEIEALRDALRRIGERARSDGTRKFDECCRDLGWIDDECRRAWFASPAPDPAAAAIRTEHELIDKITNEVIKRTRIMQENVLRSDVCDVVRFTMHYLSSFIGKDIP